MEDKKQDSILLLGMVFAHQALEPKRGQEYRDRVRCQSLQNSRRCKVFTLDDKHNGDLIEEHCQANFADTRRMMQSMKKKWNSSVIFSDIVLDYFFSPVSFPNHILFKIPYNLLLPFQNSKGRLGSMSLEQKVFLTHITSFR